MTNVILDKSGIIVAKECYYTKLWYRVDEENLKACCFIKGRNYTRALLALAREVEDLLCAVRYRAKYPNCKYTTGENVSETLKAKYDFRYPHLIVFNFYPHVDISDIPYNTFEEVMTDVVLHYPDEVQKIQSEYAKEGKYLGSSREEAVCELIKS